MGLVVSAAISGVPIMDHLERPYPNPRNRRRNRSRISNIGSRDSSKEDNNNLFGLNSSRSSIKSESPNHYRSAIEMVTGQ